MRQSGEDPITKQYPELTPYQFASNTPIQAIDLDGLEKYHYLLNFDKKGTASLKLTSVENFSEWTWKPELGNTAFGFQLWEKVKNPYKEYIVSYNTTEHVIIPPIAAEVKSTYKLSYDHLPNSNNVVDDLIDKQQMTQFKTAFAQGLAGGLSTGRMRKGFRIRSEEASVEVGGGTILTKSFSNLARHFEKRAKEGYNFKDASELAAYGKEFFQRTGKNILDFKSEEGFIHRVDLKTQEYGLVDKDGVISTVFKVQPKPNSGFSNAKEYLDIQVKTYGKQK